MLAELVRDLTFNLGFHFEKNPRQIITASSRYWKLNCVPSEVNSRFEKISANRKEIDTKLFFLSYHNQAKKSSFKEKELPKLL